MEKRVPCGQHHQRWQGAGHPLRSKPVEDLLLLLLLLMVHIKEEAVHVGHGGEGGWGTVASSCVQLRTGKVLVMRMKPLLVQAEVPRVECVRAEVTPGESVGRVPLSQIQHARTKP